MSALKEKDGESNSIGSEGSKRRIYTLVKENLDTKNLKENESPLTVLESKNYQLKHATGFGNLIKDKKKADKYVLTLFTVLGITVGIANFFMDGLGFSVERNGAAVYMAWIIMFSMVCCGLYACAIYMVMNIQLYVLKKSVLTFESIVMTTASLFCFGWFLLGPWIFFGDAGWIYRKEGEFNALVPLGILMALMAANIDALPPKPKVNMIVFGIILIPFTVFFTFVITDNGAPDGSQYGYNRRLTSMRDVSPAPGWEQGGLLRQLGKKANYNCNNDKEYCGPEECKNKCPNPESDEYKEKCADNDKDNNKPLSDGVRKLMKVMKSRRLGPSGEDNNSKCSEDKDPEVCCKSDECKKCECEHDVECQHMRLTKYVGEWRGIHIMGFGMFFVWLHLLRVFVLSTAMVVRGKNTSYFVQLRPEPLLVDDIDDNNPNNNH